MDNADQPIAPDTSKVADDARIIESAFGLGRFAPFNWERMPHATGVRVFWGRCAVWLVVLVCIGWLSLAVGAYGFVKYRRGFTEVSFQHMLLLPWKLDDYRRAKGEFLIKQGLELAEKQEWRPAFDLLRTGLVAAPDHREARLMTARIYLMAGRPDMVRTLPRTAGGSNTRQAGGISGCARREKDVRRAARAATSARVDQRFACSIWANTSSAM